MQTQWAMSLAPESCHASWRSTSAMNPKNCRWGRETWQWLASAALINSEVLLSSCVCTRDLTWSRGEISYQCTRTHVRSSRKSEGTTYIGGNPTAARLRPERG